jgi:tetratricopeptide (TPR) repeat protein
MLETIRTYATERFAVAGDEEAVHERHYDYYLALAGHHGTDRALSSAGRTERLAQLDAEVDNFHAALGWAVGQASAERALALVAGLASYWLMRSRLGDAVYWVEQALSLPDANSHPALRVRALCLKAACLWSLGRLGERPAVMADAERVARRLGDPVVLSQVLQARADYESADGRLDVADGLADEALRWARAANDEWEIARASRVRARGATSISALRERVEQAAPLLEEVGDIFQLADLLASASYLALCEGSDRDARELVHRAMPIARRLDHPFMWMIVSGNLGLAALLTGETDVARDAFREELQLCRELVVRPIAEGLRGLAAVAVISNDVERAARLLGAATAHRYDEAEDPLDTRLRATFFEPARARWGVDAWSAAVYDGAALSFEDAVAYALDEPRAPTHPSA